jgi:hypothetical protein
MAINLSSIVDALDLNLNEMFQDGLQQWPDEYSQVFNVENSDKQTEKDSYESGFGMMPAKTEGAAAQYDSILPGIKVTYTHKTYALNLLGVLKRNLEVIKRAVSVEAQILFG